MARPRKNPPRVKNYAPDLQDALAKRIDECQSVIGHLEKCPAWRVIQKDLQDQKQFIDDNWQNIPEEDKKLKELRVTKLAYMHLLQLKEKYIQDKENAEKELDKLQNTDTKIIKDFDGE